MKNQVVTRFAPSPTGMMHIGSLRTALYSYLWARHQNGKFILRIEDTDQERFVPGATEQIIETLHWAGLDYDEGVFLDASKKQISKGENGPYIQSQRSLIYQEYAQKLLATGQAYRCFCTRSDLDKMRQQQAARGVPPHYDRRCLKLSAAQQEANLKAGKPYVIRLKVPRTGFTAFKDVIRKQVKFANELIDDQVLVKSDGLPTYHLAVVVDDHLMGVNCVIRGEEWLPSTPKHILLYRAFDWQPPSYAHLPLLVDKNRRKLSKRHGDVSVTDYIKKGYLKDALLNFIALLGWNPKTAEEILTLPQLVEKFELSAVHKAAAVFDTEKLDWVNGKYLRNLPVAELYKLALPYIKNIPEFTELPKSKELVMAALSLEQTRIKKLSELPEIIGFFFTTKLDYQVKDLIWRKSDKSKTITAIEAAINKLQRLAADKFEAKYLEKTMLAFAKSEGIDNGTMFWPLRYALSGKDRSPSPFEIMGVLGKEESLARIKIGLNKLKSDDK
jgi:glutamyl-tRNA synthetase